jgi:Helix-turn-helix domain
MHIAAARPIGFNWRCTVVVDHERGFLGQLYPGRLNLGHDSGGTKGLEGEMASQSSVPAAPPSNGGEDVSRLHIRGIKEMPAGHDAELATIFREMRRAVDIPREKMARRLTTSVEILDALESGAIFALPPWPELSRIVTAYADLLGLDARPLLRRLEGQLSPDAGMVAASPPNNATPAPVAPAPKLVPAASPTAQAGGPPMPPSAAPSSFIPPAPEPDAGSPAPPHPEVQAQPQPERPAQTSTSAQAQPQPRADSAASVAGETQTPVKRTSGFLKSAINWLVLIGFVAALGAGVWYAAQRPRMVWSALDTLPDPIPKVVRSAWKFMRPLEGTTAGRQKSDPANRKSDKLP